MSEVKWHFCPIGGKYALGSVREVNVERIAKSSGDGYWSDKGYYPSAYSERDIFTSKREAYLAWKDRLDQVEEEAKRVREEIEDTLMDLHGEGYEL